LIVSKTAIDATDRKLGIAHGGIKDANYGSALSFRDPDTLPLEFFAPPV
jgi:glyoxylase I family protein